jgi:hypothetical protein
VKSALQALSLLASIAEVNVMRDRTGFPNPADFESTPDDRLRDTRYGERGRRDFSDFNDFDRPYQRGELEDDYIPSRTARRRHGFHQPWRVSGIGSAAGYAGTGGPGWTSGGFGDPGYNTSGFNSPDYGASRANPGSFNEPLTTHFSGEPLGNYGPDLDRGAPVGGHRGKGPRNFTRSDERIRELICERLTDDDRIDASDIELQVSDGRVIMNGTVPSRDMKWMAEDVVEQVVGAERIENRLRAARMRTIDLADRPRYR